MTGGEGPGTGETRDLAALVAEVERLAGATGEEAGEALAEHLGHPSWYLRERVVRALGSRTDAGPRIARALREGAWWARASACDVLARRADPSCLGEVLAAVEDPNVSLQKSAVRALAAIAGGVGVETVARGVAELAPERRRRVLARTGHQAPEWMTHLQAALDALPADVFARHPAEAAPLPASEAAETRALLRFRAWLRSATPLASRRDGA